MLCVGREYIGCHTITLLCLHWETSAAVTKCWSRQKMKIIQLIYCSYWIDVGNWVTIIMVGLRLHDKHQITHSFDLLVYCLPFSCNHYTNSLFHLLALEKRSCCLHLQETYEHLTFYYLCRLSSGNLYITAINSQSARWSALFLFPVRQREAIVGFCRVCEWHRKSSLYKGLLFLV